MRSARIPADQPNDPRAVICEQVKQMIRDRGLASTYGQHLGVSRPAMNSWRVIPAEHCIGLEQLLGVSRYEMRPDVFGYVAEEQVEADQSRAEANAARSALALATAERDQLAAQIKAARAAISLSDLPNKNITLEKAIFDLILHARNAGNRADLAESKHRLLEAK